MDTPKNQHEAMLMAFLNLQIQNPKYEASHPDCDFVAENFWDELQAIFPTADQEIAKSFWLMMDPIRKLPNPNPRVKAETVVMSHLSDAQEELHMGFANAGISYHINFAKYLITELEGDLDQIIDAEDYWQSFTEKFPEPLPPIFQ
jgi:hypothetical protein